MSALCEGVDCRQIGALCIISLNIRMTGDTQPPPRPGTAGGGGTAPALHEHQEQTSYRFGCPETTAFWVLFIVVDFRTVKNYRNHSWIHGDDVKERNTAL